MIAIKAHAETKNDANAYHENNVLNQCVSIDIIQSHPAVEDVIPKNRTNKTATL